MEGLSKTEFIGWLAVILLSLAWLPQTIETIVKKKCPTNILFLILYTLASFLFCIYSFLIEDHIFTTLNLILFVGSGINLYYKIRSN